MSYFGDTTSEIKIRLALKYNVFKQLAIVLRSKTLDNKTKLSLCNSCMLPVQLSTDIRL
jgi:hypothetical protein